MTEKQLVLDSKRLDIAMVTADIKSDEELARRISVTSGTIRNIRRTGRCQFDTLNAIAIAVGRNPIDLLVTPGHPDPNLVALAALSV